MRIISKQNQTRMHSSRMRTGRSLTVWCSQLPRVGGDCLPGPGGGVCSRGGVCLVLGGGCLPGPGGGGCLPGLGGSAWSGGGVVSAPGGGGGVGVCSQGGCYPSMH